MLILHLSVTDGKVVTYSNLVWSDRQVNIIILHYKIEEIF